MCCHYIYTYEGCSATMDHNYICQNHILHTYKQTDARNCPDLAITIRKFEGNCSGDSEPKHRCGRLPGLENEPGKTWEFETVGRKLRGHKKRSKVESELESSTVAGEAVFGDYCIESERVTRSATQATTGMLAESMSKLMQFEGGEREAKRRRPNDNEHGDEDMKL